MPEITTITSEALQAEVRRLLPSQRGFGTDLEAQNVIVPIVDLTPTADGSALREDLQTAASHGSVTSVLTQNASNAVIATPGFYKYDATLSIGTGTAGITAQIGINDGSTVKIIHRLTFSTDTNPEDPDSVRVNGVIFLKTGESIQCVSNGSDALVAFAGWQIADVYGQFTNPSGFTSE